MNFSRKIMLDAFNFENPEKIPVFYHPSPAGLYVHGKKLLDLFEEFPPENPVTFEIPKTPSPEFFSPDGSYHEIKKDLWGTEWEYLIYGIQGHPKSYPFSGWEEALNYCFPLDPVTSAAEKALINEQRGKYLIFEGWISIFEKLHALRPMDEVLIDLYTEDKNLIAFIDRLTEYWLEIIENLIDTGVDVIMFGDDWGTQLSTLVSPELFVKIFKPRYEALFAPIKKAGKRVFFHSCGFLGKILDELIDLKIDGLWPQISQFEKNPEFDKKCLENKVTLFIHPDRQRLIPLGTPKEIETKIIKYSKKYKKLGGGGIFYVEIENDAPFENVEALIRSIHRYK
jgi:uroporphyrinogen decarboxylase